MAQRKRAGPITQRSMDRNHPLLINALFRPSLCGKLLPRVAQQHPPMVQGDYFGFHHLERHLGNSCFSYVTFNDVGYQHCVFSVSLQTVMG